VPCVITAMQVDLRDDDEVDSMKKKARRLTITTAQGERARAGPGRGGSCRVFSEDPQKGGGRFRRGTQSPHTHS
jgi:hypothetical protein